MTNPYKLTAGGGVLFLGGHICPDPGSEQGRLYNAFLNAGGIPAPPDLPLPLGAGGGAYSVRWFGARGDFIADDTAAIQAAVATGKPVHFPPGRYRVTDAITCTTPGQIITGVGRDVSIVIAGPGFNMAAKGVFVLCPTEPSTQIGDLKITFIQPDTATRSALTTYPPAVCAQSAPRFGLRRMKITNATVAIDMTGNSGGAYVDDLQASFYSVGIKIDGCFDSVRLTDLHFVGFDMTPNQLSLFRDAGTVGISSGRCDDLKLRNSMFLCGTHLDMFAGATGYTFGSATNCGFDGTTGGAVIQRGGGRFELSNSYFNSTMLNTSPVSCTSGKLYISNCWFAQTQNQANPLLGVTAGTGLLSQVLVNNCTFETGAADLPSVLVGTTNSGVAEASLMGCTFNRQPNTAFTQETVGVSGTPGASLTMMGCRTLPLGTGSGTFILILRDGQHRVMGNASNGWTSSFPQAVAGVYTGN